MSSPAKERLETHICVLEHLPVISPHADFMTPEKADEYTAFAGLPVTSANISNDTSELTERFDDIAEESIRTYITDFVRRLHI